MDRAQRVILKLSGEVLAGDSQANLDPPTLQRIAHDLIAAAEQGVQIGVVLGGGNFLRGQTLAADGMIRRITGDHMGMLATVLNALALQDVINSLGREITARVYSAIPVPGIAEPFSVTHVDAHLRRKGIALFAAGTGNPFVTTDSAASLRAIEIEAEILLKATKVDGIYSEDPAKNPDAKKFTNIRFSEVLSKEYAVMDLAAFCQCRDYNIPIRVFNVNKPQALVRALTGDAEGTLVSSTL